MLKVLITGGAGFIGLYLCREYLAAGFQVGVLDNFSTGSRKKIPRGCQIFNVDIRNEKKVDQAFATFLPDIVSHHAAQSKVTTSNSDPLLDVETNLGGLVTILNSSKKYKVKHFIFASSAAVYNPGAKLPLVENSDKVPVSIYGISKLAGEAYVTFFNQRQNLPATIFRYSNVYGAGQLDQSEGGVVSVLLKKLSSGKKPTIHGDGEQTRDFVFVKDVAQINVLVTKKKITGIYNVGTATQTSINDLYATISTQLNKKTLPSRQKKIVELIKKSALNSQKLRQFLPDFTFTTLEKGLQQTIEEFQDETSN